MKEPKKLLNYEKVAMESEYHSYDFDEVNTVFEESETK